MHSACASDETCIATGQELYEELHVIEAFRDAFGRMNTRGGEEWIDTIPEDAILRMGDVRRVKEGGKVRVFEPQRYATVRELTCIDECMLRSKPYGCFYGMLGGATCNTNLDATEHNTSWDAYWAVSGSGADIWYKMTPSLLRHAENWE